MAQIYCTACHQAYPTEGVPYLCPACGGVYDWDELPAYQSPGSDAGSKGAGAPGVLTPGVLTPGVWRYRSLLGLPPDAPVVTLGEGATPLVWDKVDGLDVAYKMESLNPSGSYKDRGSAVLISLLLARGVRVAVEDSSGNAGASFAAYSARAGIKAKVFVPESASGPKRRQIEMYGAELAAIPGPRSAAAAAVIQDARAGAVYASHAYLPFGMTGIATIAYELIEQIGSVPETVIAPVGHGSLFLGIIRGFKAMWAGGAIDKLPRFIGVQSGACAPVWAAYHRYEGALVEGDTIAEGVRVFQPVRKTALLESLDRRQDTLVAVDEELILPARNELAARGIYVEPTSAIVWAALKKMSAGIHAPVVLVLSGSGYKSQK